MEKKRFSFNYFNEKSLQLVLTHKKNLQHIHVVSFFKCFPLTEMSLRRFFRFHGVNHINDVIAQMLTFINNIHVQHTTLV